MRLRRLCAGLGCARRQTKDLNQTLECWSVLEYCVYVTLCNHICLCVRITCEFNDVNNRSSAFMMSRRKWGILKLSLLFLESMFSPIEHAILYFWDSHPGTARDDRCSPTVLARLKLNP